MDVPTFFLFGVDIIRFTIDLMTAYALYLVVSLSLNLEAGFAGVPNFGKVMFVAAGAAVAGSVSGRLAALILSVNTHGDYNGFIAQIITQLDSSLSGNAVLPIPRSDCERITWVCCCSRQPNCFRFSWAATSH